MKMNLTNLNKRQGNENGIEGTEIKDIVDNYISDKLKETVAEEVKKFEETKRKTRIEKLNPDNIKAGNIIEVSEEVEQWLMGYAIPNKVHPTVIGYILLKYNTPTGKSDISYFNEEYKENGKTNSPYVWTDISNILYNFENELKEGKYKGENVENKLKDIIEPKLRTVYLDEFYNFYNTLTLTPEEVIVGAQKGYEPGDLPISYNEKFACMTSLISADVGQVEQCRKFIKAYCNPDNLTIYDKFWAGKDQNKIEIINSLKQFDENELKTENTDYLEDVSTFEEIAKTYNNTLKKWNTKGEDEKSKNVGIDWQTTNEEVTNEKSEWKKTEDYDTKAKKEWPNEDYDTKAKKEWSTKDYDTEAEKEWSNTEAYNTNERRGLETTNENNAKEKVSLKNTEEYIANEKNYNTKNTEVKGYEETQEEIGNPYEFNISDEITPENIEKAENPYDVIFKKGLTDKPYEITVSAETLRKLYGIEETEETEETSLVEVDDEEDTVFDIILDKIIDSFYILKDKMIKIFKGNTNKKRGSHSA